MVVRQGVASRYADHLHSSLQIPHDDLRLPQDVILMVDVPAQL